MMKPNIRKMLNAIGWTIYKRFSSKQKGFIKARLTGKQTLYLKKLFLAGKWQRREIAKVRQRLNNLGFIERGLVDMQEMSMRKKEPYLNRLAMWELALWHANQYNKESAKQCLDILAELLKTEEEATRIRQAAILTAECYEISGDVKPAQNVLSKLLETKEDPDVYLAMANLESSMSKRLEWINKALKVYRLSNISFEKESLAYKEPYDRLSSDKTEAESVEVDNQNWRRVTVIMPVYNAEQVIATSLDSILAQTWTDLEVLVVDDCSQDKTVQIIEEYVRKDKRVKLIKADKNGGAYVARNLALGEASGDFVTVNDADDWSHPEKIKTQANHLIRNPSVIGNMSEQARATNDLKFYRRGKPGTYIFSNMSSFMFRRQAVAESLGYWDSVRFAADSEFILRVEQVFGKESVVALNTGPLSFQRQTSDSLTGNSAFGYHGFKMGARREYEESHDYFHASASHLYYDFPQKNRPFPVPEPMLPDRETKSNSFRHFDVVIGYDFRSSSESLSTVAKDISLLKEKELKIGLMQVFQYEINPEQKVHAKVRDMIDGDKVQMVVYGEKLCCEMLVLRNPPAFQESQKYIPEVAANDIRIVVPEVSQTTSPDSEGLNDMSLCDKNIENHFGKKGNWQPLNSAVRKAFVTRYNKKLSSINLANEDWDGGGAIEK